MAAQQEQFGNVDFGYRAFDTFLVGVAAVYQLSFQRHFGAFVKVFLRDFSHLAKTHQVVPLRVGDVHALRIAVGFVGGHRKTNQFFVFFKRVGLRFASHMANELNFVFKCVHNSCFKRE